jgi:hypothetical protein
LLLRARGAESRDVSRPPRTGAAAIDHETNLSTLLRD